MKEVITAYWNEGRTNYFIEERGELVRCKDCKYYPNGDGSTKWLPCREIITPPEWYCADGEKEEKRE